MNRCRPRRRMGSKTLRRRISGFTSSMGTPFTLMRPRPRLQCATATAVFFRPKHWTDSTTAAAISRGREGDRKTLAQKGWGRWPRYMCDGQRLGSGRVELDLRLDRAGKPSVK
ncbi:unnamed protein product [Musa acuminata subsp. burmannicoides]